MRLGTTAIASAAYWDRNASDVSIFYFNAGLAPAGSTVRATYTVPVNRAARLEAAYAQGVRITVAAPVGLVNDEVQLQPGGAGGGDVAAAIFILNAIGNGDKAYSGDSGHMVAGDKVNLITNDASTGGTVLHDLSAKITEFDA